MSAEQVDVLIVGAGPAGLAAAAALRRLGVRRVLVVDREPEPGGIPRLCHHTGFGLYDLRRVYSGPAYARHYVRQAEKAGVEIRPTTTVTGWLGPRALSTTSPRGLGQVEAQAVLLATGCRERPRTARLVPGDRPAGVFTTGSLQRFVYEQRLPVGRRAVIVGAELVSLSALMTLRHSGTSVACLATELPRHQVYLPYLPAKWWLTDLWPRTPIRTGARLTRILGRPRVEAVELTDAASGAVEAVPCDTVVFTGDWIPENELARLGGLALDPASRGPRVDARFRTAAPGVFAAGNLLRGAETADASALEGARAARAVAAYLRQPDWPAPPLAIEVDEPFEWVVPNLIVPQSAPPHGFAFRLRQPCANVQVEVAQGERRLYARRFRRLPPGLTLHLPGDWVQSVDPASGPLRISAVT